MSIFSVFRVEWIAMAALDEQKQSLETLLTHYVEAVPQEPVRHIHSLALALAQLLDE